MADDMKIPGGASTEEDFYIGPSRALRADTSNNELRLHDGTKPGGWRILNVDQTNELYQERSVELDGFSFGPQLRGFLTRVGPAQYRLRQFTVDEDNLVVENPRGLAGDVFFSLADNILSSHEWTGVQIFNSAIDAQAGLDGETRGLHVGNVEGNLTGDTTGTHTGDVDVRGANFLTDPGQITLSQLNADVTDLFVTRGVPVGLVAMWAGTEDNIPESWHLCDGTGGTPDLRDRFLVGAGTTYEVGDTGGSTTHTPTGTAVSGGAHAHSVTVADHQLTIAEMPAHFHGSGYGDKAGTTLAVYGTQPLAVELNDNVKKASDHSTIEPVTQTIGGDDPHGHVGSTTAEDGAHTHDLDADPVSSLPPYYALCYIMKVE